MGSEASFNISSISGLLKLKAVFVAKMCRYLSPSITNLFLASQFKTFLRSTSEIVY